MLSGVSAGVIGLDDGRIELPNRSACELLGVDLRGLVGQRLAEVVPRDGASCSSRHRGRDAARPRRRSASKRRGSTRTLLVRVGAERGEGEAERYVVTFDDVTELLSAPSARPPGPMSPGASPTRSRTR